MAEEYIETILIRQNERPEVTTPTFVDTDVDSVFKFEGTLKLVKINKTVQNAVHNQHDYIFMVESIVELEKQEEE